MNQLASKPATSSQSARRPTAERSVSLKQIRPVIAKDVKQVDPAAEVSSHDSSDVPSFTNNRDSSGETSNVEHWFDKANRDVSGQKASLNDSDSPFSFQNNSPMQTMPSYARNLPAIQSQLLTQDSCGSSSEEYRSVIDDLTIENQRLKRRLKKYEKTHDAHLQKDKLFEVKIHGLSAEKKRELEETLRKFADTLNQSPVSADSYSFPSRSAQTHAAKVTSKATSSMASVLPADSGYGSVVVPSGKESSAHSAQDGRSSEYEKSKVNPRSIQSYLHDIPEGLLPKRTSAMSERSRKKLVVRRLEQIFGGGRGMDSGTTQQLQQQQEVSQSASKADRDTLEAEGKPTTAEGIREAQIMDFSSEQAMYGQKAEDTTPENPTETKDFSVEEESNEISSSLLEQRPTRPLDLDPYRPQYPSENIEYIRHLGIPDPEGSSQLPPTDGEHWIYLNLLINMAQLHTMNVTTDFVKQSIAELSSKIELSADGRKARWRGDKPGSELTGDSSPDNDQDYMSTDGAGELSPGKKRARSTHSERNTSSSGVQRKQKSDTNGAQNKFAYTPIFPRKDDSTDSMNDTSMADSDPSPSLHMNTNRLSSPGGGTKPSPGRRSDGGPMIFYNNAPFCTDLSGDKAGFKRSTNSTPHHVPSSRPLGVPRPQPQMSSRGSSVKGLNESVFDVSELSSSLDLKSLSNVDLKFPSNVSSPKHVKFVDPQEPIELEASGVGGIVPGDNMSINVIRQYDPTSRESAPPKKRRRSVLSGVLGNKRQDRTRLVSEKVLSTHQRKFDPSPLPPASHHFGSESDNEDGSSDSEDDSEAADLRRWLEEKSRLPIVSHADTTSSSVASDKCDGGDSEEPSDDEDMDDDDQSLDFLATARQADPAAVQTREREYDAEVAERLAEDIPAGSSAATAGGGSGFNSPALLGKGHHTTDSSDDNGDKRMRNAGEELSDTSS